MVMACMLILDADSTATELRHTTMLGTCWVLHLDIAVLDRGPRPGYSENHQRRGDLTVTLEGSLTQSIIDVSQTTSYPANGGTISDVDLANDDYTKKVLQTRYNAKMSHHIMAENSDMELVPCIIDSSGQMHEHFKAFLKKVLAVAAEQKHIPLSVIWNYWCSAIVCALFKGNCQ